MARPLRVPAPVTAFDLIVATYRRPVFLRRTLVSAVSAEIPPDLTCRVVVVDNDTERSAAATVAEMSATSPIPVAYLHEPAAGKSSALNRAIVESSARLLGFVDDDEEIGSQWFVEAANAFAAGDVEYVGGPTLPVWHGERPSWIPDEYPAVLGLVNSGSQPAPYGIDFPGMLTGANCVIARSAFAKVGLYSSRLGPRRGQRLFSCEDEDMYLRLLDGGMRGRYLPQLTVWHHVHPERLTRSYYRRWCFWHAVAKAVMRRDHPEPVASILGVPRYLYGRALRGALDWAALSIRSRQSSHRFAAELATWDLLGFQYGRYVYRDVDPIARLAPSLTEHAGCSDLPAAVGA